MKRKKENWEMMTNAESLVAVEREREREGDFKNQRKSRNNLNSVNNNNSDNINNSKCDNISINIKRRDI